MVEGQAGCSVVIRYRAGENQESHCPMLLPYDTELRDKTGQHNAASIPDGQVRCFR